MESISYYGGSDEEQENSNNSKARDNSSTNNYGNYESTSHSSSDTANSRRRKVTDDTNYEEIQMDLSEDSNASENHSSQTKVSDSKPKTNETNFISQSSHRSDKNNRSDGKPRSSSKEVDRYKGEKSRECPSRDRFSDKGRDKTADRYRDKDIDRYRDKDRERDRDRYSRDKGRSRPEKDEKYSRHRDNRSDPRRDRNERSERNDRSDQRRSNSDKDRHERGRDRRPGTRSKSKSRSRSRDRSNATSRSHDRSAIKEPPKSLMSLQLPQMPLSASSTLTAKPVEKVTVPPNIISPLLASARYTEQMQKRKLLWGNKKAEGEQQQTTNNRWEQTKFSQDSDGKMASKFLRLMGMKDAPKVDEDETQKAPDSIKKQTEMLSSMEQQYEVARQMTHTMRGMGLGFGTQPRHY